MIDCLGEFFVKVILFVGNLAILAFSCALIYVGVSSQYTFNDFKSLETIATPNNATIALIVIGAAIGLVAFMGCCGALKQSPCLLYSYGIIVLLLLIAEIAAAAIVFHFKGDIEQKFKEELQNGFDKALLPWQNRQINETDPTIKLWNSLQNHYKCCGFDSSNQYGSSHYPSSCCGKPVGQECANPSQDRQGGCYDKIREDIKSHLVLALAIGLALALVQLLIITFACCLANNRRKYRHY